jgi:hypothetical protein
MSQLANALKNREWLRRVAPFPHVIAEDVFQPEFYAGLCTQIHQMLGRGLSEMPAAGRFSRSLPGYDAYGIGFGASPSGPVSLFSSIEWRDMMCDIFGIGKTPYIFAGAHYHAVGSRDGYVHNDFNRVWFPRATDLSIQVPNQTLCAYKTGKGPLLPHDKVELVRGAVAIFYLLNDGWRRGDGGETALFRNLQTPSGCSGTVQFAPVSNSLIAFECTPFSFHTFISNHRLPRLSIIMWVHRPLHEAVARFGKDQLEQFYD